MRITVVCPSGNHPIGGVTALYEFANGLARRGHEIHLVHLPMWGRRVNDMDDLRRYHFEAEVLHYLPGADPDSLPDGDIVFGTGAPERLGLPVLLVQGFEMLHPHLEREAFRTPGLKVCVASWLVDVGRAFGVRADQFRLAPMGIDHRRYRVIHPIEDRPLRIAMLHSSHPAKGWEVGLRAILQVKARLPELRVATFGTAEPPGPLPEWVSFLRDPEPGRVEKEIYNDSQVFLQASDYEGFGFTAVEAMASGCALVTTDNGGSRDYAVAGKTALIADPGDADALAQHLIDLLTDPPRRIRLARAGHRFVDRFTWDIGAARLEDHLRDYLATPSAFQRPPEPEIETDEHLTQGDLAARVLARTRPDP